MNDNVMVLLYSALVIIFWGIGSVCHKLLSNDLKPNVIVMYSFVLYCIGMFVYIMYNRQDFFADIDKVDTKNFLLILVIALVSSLGANILYSHALHHTENSTFVSVLTSLYPVCAMFLAYWFLNEKINKMSLLGIALVVAGVVIMGMHTDY